MIRSYLIIAVLLLQCLVTFSALRRAQWTALVTGRYMITVMMMLLCYVNLSGGQRCTDSVDIQQAGIIIGRDRLAIIPRLNFTCDGRITSIRARVFLSTVTRNDYPFFQVWRPVPTGSTVYNKIDEVQLQSDDQVIRGSNNFNETNIILTGDNTIEFQSGDVVGYYHPPQSRYQVVNMYGFGNGYVLYRFDGSPAPNSVGLSERDDRSDFYQPLLQFSIDIQCHALSTPANGMIFCSSGRVGVGYEGDNCGITCNTGYELTGNDTRTCQSDGSWSGTDSVCSRVSCPLLTDPNNGMINCSLGDDGVPSYEDACSFTCNTGYELTGSDTRTCQDNGSWSRTDSVCSRVSCPLLNSNNGMIIDNCSLGDDGVPSYEDTCNFTCNTGYELISNNSRTCQSNGSWSGSDDMCIKGTSTDNSGSESSIPIIAGSVGGAGFFLVTFLLCGVMLGIRLSHKKRSLSLDNKMISDVKMDDNPSYSIITQNEKQDDQHDYVLHKKFSMQDNTKDTIKMDSNPSYGRVQGCYTVADDVTEPDYDVTIQTNPSYDSILKETTKMSEDEDQQGYVETSSHSIHRTAGYIKIGTTKEEELVYNVATDDIDNVKIDPNPSYESVSKDVKL